MTNIAEQVEALHNEKQLLMLEQEVADLRVDHNARQRFAELELQEAFGDIVDRSEYLHDTPGWGYDSAGAYKHYSQIGDRAEGKNRPVFETEIELSAIRGAARILADNFATAICAREVLTSYVMGDGFEYKLQPVTSSDTALASAAQAEVANFLARHKWYEEVEEEKFDRERVDGEFMAALTPSSEGVDLCIIEPPQVTEPQDSRVIADHVERTGQASIDAPDSWTFGVHSDARNARKVYGYYVQWTDSPHDWDYIPAARMVHVKRNVPGNVKRGLSDFYAVQSYLANTGKLDRNVALGAAILSAIVGIVQHPQGTSGSKVLDLIRGNAWRRTTSNTPAGSKSNYYQKVEPGSWLHTPSGQEYKQSPLANQGVGQAYVSIKQALVRTLGSRWCMPEFLISSDASNANYGSTLVAESPWVKYAKRQQGRERWSNERMLWQMLAIRASAGAFRRYGVESLADLMRAVAIVVTGPIVEARDRPQETNRRKILRDSGIISPKTWATEEGYDYEQEQRDGARVSQVTLPAAESRLREAAGLWEGYP